MEYSFTCYGHENVTCKHKTTLEFTKDSELSLNGDCIVGIGADFQINEIKEFIRNLKSKKITITIETINNKENKINNKNKNNNMLLIMIEF